MDIEQIKDEEKEPNITSENITQSNTNKKKIIINCDKSNEIYYSELNQKEPRTSNQSIDYYDLLKQQIKYYKELNSSLKEEIETIKQYKRIKELNEINKLTLMNDNKEKDEINDLLISNNKSTELNLKDLKLSDLQKEPNLNLMNTLEQNKESAIIFLEDSKNFGNSGSDEQWLFVKKEMKKLEDENTNLKNSVELLNETIKNLKLSYSSEKYGNENKLEDVAKSYNKNDINNNNINITINKNEDGFDFKNKLMSDNQRLKIYIEKIEQMQKLLIRYEAQINLQIKKSLKKKKKKILKIKI